jgi:hypothetical protein
MEDLDKQLEGMKQDVTGTQVWNQSTTSYYQANGDDPYDYACGEHKADSFFNADGDAADLQKKLADAINQRVPLQNALTTAQENYDEANARNCPSPCKGQCHPKCDTKSADKRYWGDALPIRRQNIADNEANIVRIGDLLTTRLNLDIADRTAAGKTEAEKKEADAKVEAQKVKDQTRKELAKQGLTPEAIELKLSAEAKSKGRNKAFIIGGSIALIVVFGFMFLRRRNG